MKQLIFLFVLSASTAFSQSAKKENSALKNELTVAKAHYDSVVSGYLSEFKLLEKARQDYRSYSKNEFAKRQAYLNRQITDLRKLMSFCEDFNIDYTKLVNEAALKNAESFNYQIDVVRERSMLTEILVFQNVKDTLVLEGLKPKAQNMLLKTQLGIYTTAQNQNALVISKQKSLLSTLKNASEELDSLTAAYNLSIVELNKSFQKLQVYMDELYNQELKKGGNNRFTERYKLEFNTKPASIPGPETDLIPEIPAEFPGGDLKFKQYIADHIQLPVAITEAGFSGKCYVQFTVKSTGEIADVIVLKGITECPDCSPEAARLVKEMPKWIPGKMNNSPVNSRVVVPVNFAVKK